MWTGVCDIETDEDGWVTFWRVPRGAGAGVVAGAGAAAVSDERFWDAARHPAGVCARWRTDARMLMIEVRGPGESSPVDVLVNGVLHERFTPVPGGAVHSITLPVGPLMVEVWLPQSGLVQVRRVEFVGGETHVDSSPRPHWITYGSSITQCSAALGPSETWPALVAREHHWRLTCIGLGGQCHLDPIVARSIRDTPADLISLCLGINIYSRSTFSVRSLRPQVEGFLQTIRDGHPHTPILVMTPIGSPSREDVRNTGDLTLHEVREEIAAAVGVRRHGGDDRLYALDGRCVISVDEADEYLHDGLHPSAEGYRLMATRLSPVLHGYLSGV